MKTVIKASILFFYFLSFTHFLSVAHASFSEVDYATIAPGCPQSCSIVGPDPSNWIWIPHASDVYSCKVPILFDFQIGNDPTSSPVVRSCAVHEPFSNPSPRARVEKVTWSNVDSEDSEAVEQSLIVSKSCGASQQSSDVTVDVGPSGEITATDDANTAVKTLASYMTNAASCGSTILLSKAGDVVAALYAGADVYPSDVGSFLDGFTKDFQDGSQTIQACNTNSKQDDTIGVYLVNSWDNLEDVYRGLQTWAKGDCLSTDGQHFVQAKMTTLGTSETSKRSIISSFFGNLFATRSDCRTITVNTGDSCSTLATRCGVSANDFSEYNSADLCSTLVPNEHVCCSAGSLPVHKRQQNDLASRDTCRALTVKSGDSCSTLATRCGISPSELINYNGAAFCYNLVPDERICCSVGSLPDISSERQATHLATRGDCRTITVNSGDSCGSLASRCGISAANFNKYNSADNLCSTLTPKERVCCSAGSLPDITPKPQSDGTCATHTIQTNDNCADIAAQFGITTDDINDYNKDTWAWAGCKQLIANQVICLSEGNSPMPSPLSNAVCGPQKPGTKAPSGNYTGWDLAKLNPCPLNACCSGWGFCGTTAEFCTVSNASTGAPGAFQKGKNGCIWNCGTDVVNNDDPPAEFYHVAYYEVFNLQRDCLKMAVTEIDDDSLTHVHFAFAGLTEDFDIHFDNDDYLDQFQKFIDLDASFKKVLSFGGWAESTDSGTFQRYRDVVKPGNREKFAKNIVSFFDKYNLDGIDFDWEYPGATDIPGVPAGTSNETGNYLDFLELMSSTIGDRSLSIALPASYWYLKAFPIKEMAPHVSYFIYMTYDLHGQWGEYQ